MESGDRVRCSDRRRLIGQVVEVKNCGVINMVALKWCFVKSDKRPDEKIRWFPEFALERSE